MTRMPIPPKTPKKRVAAAVSAAALLAVTALNAGPAAADPAIPELPDVPAQVADAGSAGSDAAPGGTANGSADTPAADSGSAPSDDHVGNSSELPGASGSSAGSSAVDGVLDALPANPTWNDPATAPFYEPPATIPAPGTVIRTAPGEQLLQKTGIDWPGTAEKIMYASTNERGEPTAVTGVVFTPTKEWEGEGPQPTVILAPGTLGQGRQCAPSAGYGMFLNMDLGVPTVATNYELVSAYGALSKGARVIMTDYIGMGTPGPHTYVNSADEAQAVLDAGRAGLSQIGLPADSPVAIMGYSQGGGAAASAAERAPEYAPDLNIVATYAGAPPADLREVLKQIDGSLITGAIGYALNSGLRYNPQLESLVDVHLNEEGKDFLDSVRTQCIVDTAATWGLKNTSEFTKDGITFSELLERIPEVASYVDRQKLGQGRVPDHPIRIDNSAADDVIPPGQAEQLGRDYCSLDGHVDMEIHHYDPTIPRSALDHALPMLINQSTSLEFVMNAFHGEVPESNCGSF
ncbi:lipase family protein [Corynebacterium sp. 335C]